MTPRHETVVALRGANRARSPQQAAPAVAATSASSADVADFLGDDRILKPKEAAKAAGFSDPTFQAWRSAGIGPPYVSINGRCVGYRIGALRKWIRDRERGGATE